MSPRFFMFASVWSVAVSATTARAAGSFHRTVKEYRSRGQHGQQTLQGTGQNPRPHGVARAPACVVGKVMIETIRAWLNGTLADGGERTARGQDELEIALTALLIEAAHSDNHFDQAERTIIARLLERRF